MKIILVLPKFETHIITPPLGIGYLASALKERGHEVILLDCVLKEIGPKDFGEILQKEKPDVVGVSAMTTYYFESKKYIKEAKRKNIITIMGGPHVTALPEEVLKDPNVDFITIGEADQTIQKLIEAIEGKKDYKKIPGIGFKKNNQIIINPRAELIKDLDSIPIPAWNLMDPRKYPIAPHGAFCKKFPVAAITTTRGCPFNCSFCASKKIWMQRLRYRTPQKVVDEIELLNKKYGVKEIHFEDDNFTSNREHAMEVCKEIIKRKLNIVWACPNGVRIDRLDEELLKYMKKSGCYLLAFGIESGDQEIVNKMNKHLDLSKVPKILELVKKSGIATWGFFILGLPGETMKSATKTINFAKNNKFDRAQFCIFTPLPGSDLFTEWAKGKKNFKWEKFNFFNIVYSSKELPVDKLKKLHKKAFRDFYFRPNIMFNLLKNFKIKQIKWLIKRAIQYGFFKKKKN